MKKVSKKVILVKRFLKFSFIPSLILPWFFFERPGILEVRGDCDDRSSSYQFFKRCGESGMYCRYLIFSFDTNNVGCNI